MLFSYEIGAAGCRRYTTAEDAARDIIAAMSDDEIREEFTDYLYFVYSISDPGDALPPRDTVISALAQGLAEIPAGGACAVGDFAPVWVYREE